MLRTVLVLFGLLSLASCADAVSPAADAGGRRAREAIYVDVPPRGSDLRNSWDGRPDSALWRGAAETRFRFVVGLKEPGAPRGVWRDRILISPARWAAGIRTLAATPGVAILSADTILPNVLVELASEAVLRHLRSMEFVDYVEPSRLLRMHREPAANAIAPRFSGDGGSGSGSGCSSPPPYERFFGTTSAGDLISWSFAPKYNNVVEAWRRSQGDGVRIALLDTGVDSWQPQLTTRFTITPYGSRSIWYDYTNASSSGVIWTDDCGHGTRMAAVIAAPLDGSSVVGMAYMADFISIRLGASVMPSQEAAYAGIHKAMDPARPAHIVVMAFATDDDLNQMTDAIRYYYYRMDGNGRRNGPLFIAAAGTNLNVLYPNYNVSYPAELPEVIAVSAVDSTWTFDPASHYGPEVDLSGFMPQGTVGTPGIHVSPPQVTSISGSSGATASVAAIAALVWARYPGLTNEQVRQHLYRNTTRYPNRTDKDGFGTLLAYRAVGGFAGVAISGPASVSSNTTHTFTAQPVGDGPFTYRWSNGATTQSTTYTIGEHGRYITLEVTDVFENRVRDAIHRVEVSDGSSEFPCDPNLDPMCPS